MRPGILSVFGLLVCSRGELRLLINRKNKTYGALGPLKANEWALKFINSEISSSRTNNAATTTYLTLVALRTYGIGTIIAWFKRPIEGTAKRWDGCSERSCWKCFFHSITCTGHYWLVIAVSLESSQRNRCTEANSHNYGIWVVETYETNLSTHVLG